MRNSSRSRHPVSMRVVPATAPIAAHLTRRRPRHERTNSAEPARALSDTSSGKTTRGWSAMKSAVIPSLPAPILSVQHLGKLRAIHRRRRRARQLHLLVGHPARPRWLQRAVDVYGYYARGDRVRKVWDGDAEGRGVGGCGAKTVWRWTMGGR